MNIFVGIGLLLLTVIALALFIRFIAIKMFFKNFFEAMDEIFGVEWRDIDSNITRSIDISLELEKFKISKLIFKKKLDFKNITNHYMLKQAVLRSLKK